MKTQASAGLKTKNRRGKALDAASMAEAPRLPSLRDELDGAVSPEQLQALIASVSARAFAHVRELLRTLGMAAELIAAGAASSRRAPTRRPFGCGWCAAVTTAMRTCPT